MLLLEATGLAGWFCCCNKLSGSRLLATPPSCCHVPSPMLPLTPLSAHACVAGTRSGSLGVAKLVAFLGNRGFRWVPPAGSSMAAFTLPQPQRPAELPPSPPPARHARPHICCGRCCCWRCAAPPLCRQAEVLVLAESLIEFMDGGRDDAICFPDFLQVRCCPALLHALVVLWLSRPAAALAVCWQSPCGSACCLAPSGSNTCSKRTYTAPCIRMPCSVMTSFWRAPWQTCSPPASAAGRRAAWRSSSAMPDNRPMHHDAH